MIFTTPPAILFVDDDPVFRESLRITLGQVQDEWICHEAASVQEAIAQMSRQVFDLLLVDVHLPDGTAADVIHASGTMPCLLCTQDDVEPTFRRIFDDASISQNIVGYLTKPLKRGAIWSIRAGLEIGRARQVRNRLVAEATANLEKERQQIAHNLHDAMGASLTQLIWAFFSIEREMKAHGADPALIEKITVICEQGTRIVRDAHAEVSQAVTQLRPDAVDVVGLRSAIEYMVAQWHATAPAVHFEYTATADLEAVDVRIAGIVYRLVQEGITNAMRHLDPVSVNVDLSCRERNLFLVVLAHGKIREEKDSYLLTVLRERTSSLGGDLQFTCDVAREESRLLVTIPI